MNEQERDKRIPKSKSIGPEEMPDTKLNLAIKTEIKEWNKFSSTSPKYPFEPKMELWREFKFKSFISAVEFMNKVGPGFDILNHHPRWENVWKTLTVYTTTWDIGYKISDRDLQLAKYLDREFLKFEGASKKVTNNELPPPKEFILELQELIAKNKLDDAIEDLKNYLHNSKSKNYNFIIKLKKDLGSLHADWINGLISRADQKVELSNIIDRLLKFIDTELKSN